MGITERGVGHEQALLFAGPLRKFFRTQLQIEKLRCAVAATFEAEEFRGRIDQRRGSLAGAESRMVHHILEKRDVRFDAANTILRERAVHAGHGDFVGRSVGDQLRQHRIVKRGDHRPGESHAAINTDAKTSGGAVGHEAPVVGHEFVFRVFRRDPGLEGVAITRNIRLLRHTNLRGMQGMALSDE